jgi:MFS family permease
MGHPLPFQTYVTTDAPTQHVVIGQIVALPPAPVTHSPITSGAAPVTHSPVTSGAAPVTESPVAPGAATVPPVTQGVVITGPLTPAVQVTQGEVVTGPLTPAVPVTQAVLYTFSDNSFWLIGVQVLDGVGASIFGALTPLVIADIMRGTGRYNLAQGAVAAVQGIGASLSGLIAGVIVDHFGYSVTFLTLGAAAAVALVVFAIGMPETTNQDLDYRTAIPQNQLD